MEKSLKVEKTRFDTKLTKVQKELFELATKIGGYRTLTNLCCQQLKKRPKPLCSNTKRYWLLKMIKLFFDAIMNPPQESQRLKDAAKRYQKFNDQSAKA